MHPPKRRTVDDDAKAVGLGRTRYHRNQLRSLPESGGKDLTGRRCAELIRCRLSVHDIGSTSKQYVDRVAEHARKSVGRGGHR